MTRIQVGVCEAHPELVPGGAAWRELAARVRDAGPDLFLLNEMPFGEWICARELFQEGVFNDAVACHDEGVDRLGELGAPVVLGTRARWLEGRRVNEAFVWTREEGLRGIHTKQYFPDEEEYFEARWFQPGERHFRIASAGKVQVGFLICTEVMFNEHARRYGREGARIVAVPRATPRTSTRRWMTAMKMAAIVSGCYVLSSNRSGEDSRGQRFGGCGWVVDPRGDRVAQTSPETPVVFYELDTAFVGKAQSQYPCYVKEDS